MSNSEERIVAGIKLKLDGPTNVAMHRLRGWVIWQFPRPQKSGYQGAIRPAIPNHAWIPAVIRADKNRVRVYGHVPLSYATPEEAVAYFKDNEKS